MGRVCFSDGRASFLIAGGGGAPWGGIDFDGGVGVMPPSCPPPPTLWETLKPFIKKGLLEEMEGVNDNASAFMHLNIKANK